eukprot:g7684.t1
MRLRGDTTQHAGKNLSLTGLLLLLLDALPRAQAFTAVTAVAGFNIENNNLRLWTSTARTTQRSFSALFTLTAGGDDSDAIAGYSQLDGGWETNTVGGAGHRVPDSSSSNSSREAARRASPPPPLSEGDGGGSVHGGYNTGGGVGGEEEVSTWRAAGAATTSAELLESLKAALAAREPLMRKLKGEKTDCYRLFHGAVEGCPGLTVDRYGTVVLVQTFRDPPADFGAAAVEDVCRLASDAINAAESGVGPSNDAISFLPVWNDRRKRDRRWGGGSGIRGGGGGEYEEGGAPHKLSSEHDPLPEALGVKVGLENGVRYPLAARHRGIDPWLFLDLRAARKWMLNNSKGKEVLNLFSYTGGVAAAAACGGAASVWNVDFAASAHEVGRASLKLNAGSAAGECECEWMKRDVLPTIRQLAGTPTRDYREDRRGRTAKMVGGRHARDARGGRGMRGSGRRRAGSYGGDYGRGGGAAEEPARRKEGKEKEKELKAKQFDLVFLDPPTWSKSKHGAVDLVRDYQTLFKPSLLATKEGGAVVATNHVSTVDCEEWVESLTRCATKAGRMVQSVHVLPPEEDFPSPDGRHPLKVAIIRV